MAHTTTDHQPQASPSVVHGDQLRGRGSLESAIEAYLVAAAEHEVPPAALCARLARGFDRLGNPGEACRWAERVVEGGHDFASWQAAAVLVERHGDTAWSGRRRSARLALLGSYTTSQLALMLRLAARRFGVSLEVYECAYGQYRQEILDPQSDLYAFAPDVVVLAVHEGDLALPELSSSPERDVDAELGRWWELWRILADRCGARVVQHNFAVPPDVSVGHLSARLPGSRYMMTQAVNARLAERATAAAIVDCDRLASIYGKERWFDPRYWHLAKQAVAPGALPLVARHTAAVVAADLGLSRKCVVLDLDNTLWGGVVGEDGLDGIQLGDGVEGEAYVAFQEYLLKLKDRGVLLAVCSKNNEDDAREPFERRPEMRLRLDDLAVFSASWEPKSEQLRRIAQTLNIGLDAVLFVDDNPAEREVIRQVLPEVAVLPLPSDPAYYARALAQCLLLEPATLTPEDLARTEQYRARAQGAALQASAGSLDDFYRSLQMQAVVAPIRKADLPRVVQLLGKTNQFNVTTRRHGEPQVAAFMADPDCVHLTIRLRDRFADHGLVGVMIAVRQGDVLDIDTWLMSCRVIGRTVEAEMLKHVSEHARRLGCTTLQGTYNRTSKNGMVADLYPRFGFEPAGSVEGALIWRYDLRTLGTIQNAFIATVKA